MFHDVERRYERIFYILGIEKSDLDEDAEVMFFVGELPCEIIICFLDVVKNVFGKDEALFQGVVLPHELILCFLTNE
jgi:hypothetical protein